MNNNLIDDCKKYLGKSPYDEWPNVCVGDVYFYRSMCEKYGEQDVMNAINLLK